MPKRGEAWIESDQKRALEKVLIGPLLPAAGGLAVAARLGGGLHDVPRSLYPGDTFKMKKLGDPERDSFMLRWARRAMIDELPQVLSIHEGSMTLIGPRADKPEHIRDLFDALGEDSDLRDQWQEVRFRQKPGIISAYAIHSHRRNLEGVPENVRFSQEEAIVANARLRAELDIADFEAASLRHDLHLVRATAGMAVANYTQYAQNLVLPQTRPSEV